MIQDSSFTDQLKAHARSLGADLVGVAPVSRWAKAPIEHSPLGVYPGAKNVIVCGIHFLDAPTELGAEVDPRDPGPAMTEMNVSAMLQDVAYRMCKHLQSLGHKAMFVRQSGAWRYRAANGDRGWVGDICHYYAAVCAGLGEIGWNNLCLTPEYGPRQRFISIITDADLTADPLYDGPSLCDRCKLCVKHCPTDSFNKDVSGKMLSIEIEDKRYEFPDRNLWRCAIGENFMLDVFLPQWTDQNIDERLVLEMEEKAVREHPEWVTGWKMGMCLKHCMPPERRYFDRSYCKAPRRRRDVTPDASQTTMDQIWHKMEKMAGPLQIDMLATASLEDFAAAGVDLRKYLPDAASAVIIGLAYPENCHLNVTYHASKAEIEVGQLLQEEYGFSSLPRWGGHDGQAAVIADLATPADTKEDHKVGSGSDANYSLRMFSDGAPVVSKRFGQRQLWRTIVTNAPLGRRQAQAPAPEPAVTSPTDLREKIAQAARQAGADLVGVAAPDRIAQAAPQIEKMLVDKDYFIVSDKDWPVQARNVWGGQGWPYNPELSKGPDKCLTPQDHLPGARSVIVVGLGLLEASIEQGASGEGNKAGHYHTSTHEESFSQLSTILLKVARVLEAQGFQAVPTFDLCGLASKSGGQSLDLTACRFAALAAGVGELGLNGLVLTPEHGAAQRFACIVTDAELPANDVYAGPTLCLDCGKCMKACPVAAISPLHRKEVEIGGRKFAWATLDALRCDCAKRYGLVADEGGKFIGSQNDVELPEIITSQWLMEAFANRDRIQRPTYTPTMEGCFIACPAGRKK